MKILLLGENGSLGREFKKFFKDKKVKFYGLSRKKNKIKFTHNNLKKIIEKISPDIILNCIALTGLIYCENKSKEAYKVNTSIPINLLKIIDKKKIKLIHFSTEAVFQGKIFKKIYLENDKPNPKTIYGKSKFLADKKILKSKNTLVIRLPMLFGPTHKNQIVSKLLIQLLKGKRIYVADDVYSTPVFSPELCKFVYLNCIKKDIFFKKKLIHFTSPKIYSIYSFIIHLSKNIKGIEINNIIKVKDAYFKNGIKIKPKNLGLTSLYRSCIKKINFKVAKQLI
jgi:dTDP-4-dehydrorhamnose reductase